MKQFNWLHFTDLHCGQRNQEWLWPTFQKHLFDDLNRLYDSSVGPWDLVLFSGDLTQSGTIDQFAELTAILAQIRSHLARFQCDPVFLFVPGNHDLSRPSPTSSVVKALQQWHRQSDVREMFWDSDSNEYRQAVVQAFQNYASWWSAVPFVKPLVFTPGILPGDFSAVVEKPGIRVGIVGLNSTFLQLSDRDYEGRLDLHQRQLLAVCDKDPDGWCEQVDIALLMTHHGYQWLERTAREHFLSEIYPPGRFFAHIYGHLHDPDAMNVGSGGAEERRYRQGPSLFGLKTWGKGRIDRVHGYVAGQFQLTDRAGSESLWPRRLSKKLGGHWDLGPDVLYSLNASNSMITLFQSKKQTRKALPAPVTHGTGESSLEGRTPAGDGVTTPDNFGVEESLLSDSIDPEFARRKLRNVPRFKLKAEPQHLNIRQTEQTDFLVSLAQDRGTWLFADWGLGREAFLACVLEKLRERGFGEVYELNCDEVDSFEKLDQEILKQFGFTLQEFCSLNTRLRATILIIDEIPSTLYGSGRDALRFDRTLSSITDFCPGMHVILTARQRQDNLTYNSVELRPLDISETASYVANSAKAGPELSEPNAIDELFLRSEGLPMHLDRLIETLQITSLKDLVNIELDQPLDCVSAKEPVPKALRQAVASLAQSTDKYTRRSYRMLKVLCVLPEGATLEMIRRFDQTEPFYPRNALELTDLGLLRAVVNKPEYEDPEIVRQMGEPTDIKQLMVPRQVRDYVKSNLADEEHMEIVKSLAALLFGERWREGIIKVRPDKTAATLGVSSAGPGNEHSVTLRLLRDAIHRNDTFDIEKALEIGTIYCRGLENANRYRDVRVATEDLLTMIDRLGASKYHDELSLMRAESLRMIGERQKALDAFNEVLVSNAGLTKDQMADLHLSVALIHDTDQNGPLAIESALKAQSLAKKNSSLYYQSETIKIRFRENGSQRRVLLKGLEEKARHKKHFVVANNICLSLAEDEEGAEAERLSLLETVLSEREDPYNRIRAAITKTQYLNKRAKLDRLTQRDLQLLLFAYSFLFSQRMANLFNQCHRAIWGILKFRNDTIQLLRIFRLSSFLWRIRGKDSLEKTYLSEIEKMDLKAIRGLRDERVRIDVDYLDRRRQKGIA